MKTALIHDWLLSATGGSESCLWEIHSLFPSPIYTLLWNPKVFANSPLRHATVYSSFLEKFPFAKTKFRSYLPFFPMAIEQFDLSQYDLILSSSHCVAKGVIGHPDQLHICYCHSPMRYAWDLSQQCLKEAGLGKGLKGALAKFFLHYLRGWDVQSSERVDHFIAVSQFVARRIRRFYRREADVIYPPVDTSFFNLHEHKEDFYCTASRFVPYKRIDLIVEAFSLMPHKKLVVIGDGPEMKSIRSKAGRNVELMGYQPNEILVDTIKRSKAFVFAALEDFGIAPIEAMATGTPVIAFGRGGALETVVDGTSGLFFEEQTIASLCAAIERFETMQWNPQHIRSLALRFSKERFCEQYRSYVLEKLTLFKHETLSYAQR